MASAAPNEKRKRGRPTASAEDKVASIRRRLRNSDGPSSSSRVISNIEADEPDERPRKRDRKEKERDNRAAPQEVEAPNTRGKGRKPKGAGKENSEAESETNGEADAPASKPGRPPKGAAKEKNQRDGDSGASQSQAVPKKRGRPSKKLVDEEPSSPGHGAENENPQPKKRRRPSREQAQHEGEGEGEGEAPARRKRARRKSRALQAQEGGNNEDQDEPQQTQPKRRKSSRKSDPEPAELEEEEEPVNEDEDDDDNDDDEIPDYSTLIPQTNFVSSRTINAKWTTLDGPSIAMVTTMLHDAARPVLLRLKDNKKRVSAASALQAISNRLRNKMAKGLPFPPPSTTLRKSKAKKKQQGPYEEQANEGESRLGELGFESVVDGVRATQRRLTPLLHSVSLLEKERVRLEQELKWDYETLRRLEKNAKTQKKTWRGQTKKNHPLVPIPEEEDSEKDENWESSAAGKPMEGIEMKLADRKTGRVFRGIEDPELLVLAHQVGSHMESITGNLQQIEGVVPAIERSRAALQGVLHGHLDGEGYEHVMLG